MSYKYFFNMGHDDDFYNSCRPSAGANLEEIYSCCRKTCGKSKVCKYVCNSVFPGSILQDCAHEADCWNGGYFDAKCLSNQTDQLYHCCMNNCHKGNLTNRTMGHVIIETAPQLNCKEFCSASLED